MKSKTVTREYDADGKLLKETTVEYDDQPARVIQTGCTCWQTYPSTVMPYCPIHGYGGMVQPYQVWCSTSSTMPAVTSNTYTVNVSADDAVHLASRISSSLS
jgi:hypothetical protein